MDPIEPPDQRRWLPPIPRLEIRQQHALHQAALVLAAIAEKNVEMVEERLVGGLGLVDHEHEAALARSLEQTRAGEARPGEAPLTGDRVTQGIPGHRGIEHQGDARLLAEEPGQGTRETGLAQAAAAAQTDSRRPFVEPRADRLESLAQGLCSEHEPGARALAEGRPFERVEFQVGSHRSRGPARLEGSS